MHRNPRQSASRQTLPAMNDRRNDSKPGRSEVNSSSNVRAARASSSTGQRTRTLVSNAIIPPVCVAERHCVLRRCRSPCISVTMRRSWAACSEDKRSSLRRSRKSCQDGFSSLRIVSEPQRLQSSPRWPRPAARPRPAAPDRNVAAQRIGHRPELGARHRSRWWRRRWPGSPRPQGSFYRPFSAPCAASPVSVMPPA